MGVTASEFLLRELRRARVAAGLTQEDLARKINYSNSHVSGIETGQRPPRSDYLAAIDKTLDTGGIFARMLAELVSTETTPAWLREWHAIERAATALRWYEPAFVRGLLQTEAYAREVLRMGGLLSEVEVEQRIASRMERQAILKQDSPPQLIAVIDETVLRRPCRGPQSIMAEQLDHLAEMATLPHIYVHVVPLTTPQYPGLQGGFIIAELAGESGGRVAYADDQLSAQIVDKPDDVANLARTWEAIRAEALPRVQSLDLIKEAAKSWT